MISGINHITFAVSDLDRSVNFYARVLGCEVVYSWDAGAYLDAGGVWLCLSVDENATGNLDYSHTAFSVAVEDFAEASKRICNSGAVLWKENHSEGSSLYFCCPDGHRLELHVGNLKSRLRAIRESQSERCGAV